MIVDLFIPCYVDQVMPQTAWNMIRLLESIGCAVNYNHEQTCCGHPAFEAGYWDDSREVAQKFISEFNNDRYIIAPSVSCIDFIQKKYSEMFANSASLNELKSLQKNLYEFSDFVLNVLKITQLGSVSNAKVALIDFCRCNKNNAFAEALLLKVKGIELIKIENECCGFGGMFSVKYENISSEMAKELVHKVVDSGAAVLLSTEAACIMQLNSYVKENKIPLKIMSVIDYIAEGLQ
jgi:L-lactate dehydrogenase complex protein LldE